MTKKMNRKLILPQELTAKQFFDFSWEDHKNWILKVKKPKFPFFIHLYKKAGQSKEIGSAVIDVVVVIDTNGRSPLDSARGIIEKYDPDYYLVLAEGWGKFYDTSQNPSSEHDKFMKNYEYGDIKKLESKVEIMQVTGKSKDGKHEFQKTMRIIRNKSDEIIDFVDLRKVFGESLKGKTSKLP